MKGMLKYLAVFAVAAAVVSAAIYAYLPVNRVGISSELVMLGDLNNDGAWNSSDVAVLNAITADPFNHDALTLQKLDLNKNHALDYEDLVFFGQIYNAPNPYAAKEQAENRGMYYPRPRELFSYIPRDEYIQPPLFLLDHDIVKTSPLVFLKDMTAPRVAMDYRRMLLNEIYSEAIRFSLAWQRRKDTLSEIETDYAKKKIARCNRLYEQGDYYQLLLDLIALVEDAETLSLETQPAFIKKILFFRDHLRELIVSPGFVAFEAGDTDHSGIFTAMEAMLKADLGMDMKLMDLAPPRDFSDPKNYTDRAQWQAYKSKTKKQDFRRLVQYAQHDRRYLRAVSNTSPRMQDVQLRNHNLPMILLFRKARAICGGNKKAALGLVDEAVRIPLGWVKSIPKELLPSSVAFENFLLPGNMEDGLDKTRHWNVFGGVALYKSPRESLELALRREIMDLKQDGHSPAAMREFIRDTIANIHGIYYVVAMEELRR